MKFHSALITLLLLFPGVARATPPTVVIVPAGWGGGHNTSAQCIRDRLLAADPDARIELLPAENYLTLADRIPPLSRASTFLFDKIYQWAPRGYEFLFDHAMSTARGKTTAAELSHPWFSSKALLADLRRIKPDVIYSTYHLGTAMLIGLRQNGSLSADVPIAWLDTDFVHEPFFYLNSLGADLTFLAHPTLAAERERLGIAPQKMAITGLFINPFVLEPFTADDRRDFLRRAMSVPDRAEPDPRRPAAREIWINGLNQNVDEADVELNPDVMTVTIASGRAGVGDYPTIIEGLIHQARARGRPIQIVAVCGDNDRNYDAVVRLWSRLFPDGAPDDVTLVASHLVDNAKLMRLVRSSALFIGKCGSQSPFEAAVMGVPRVLIDVIGGQERWTANFYAAQGLAEVVKANQQNQLAARAFAYLEDPERMRRMREADDVVRASYDLTPITRFMTEALAKRAGKPAAWPADAPEARRAPRFLRCPGWLTRVLKPGAGPRR